MVVICAQLQHPSVEAYSPRASADLCPTPAIKMRSDALLGESRVGLDVADQDISGGLERAARRGDLRAVAASMLFGRPAESGPHLFLSQLEAEPNQGIFGAAGQPPVPSVQR